MTPQAWDFAEENDTLSNWLAAYFEIEVTTATSSRQVQLCHQE